MILPSTMRIDINQHPISIGEKYDISIEGSLTYKASSRLFRIFSRVDLYKTTDTDPVLSLQKRFAPFRIKYDIYRGGDIYTFRTIKTFKRQYRCEVGRDAYDIYGHRSRKYSVFRNDKQVAWWELGRVAWFDGDNYALLANDNADRELLIAFCLLIDDYHSNFDDRRSAAKIHLGYIGPESRPFDEQWSPDRRTI